MASWRQTGSQRICASSESDAGTDLKGGERLFYPNIAAERAKRKMSVDAMAKSLGVTRKTVYNWETSGHIPQKALEKMADMFNCTIDYLLATEEEM